MARFAGDLGDEQTVGISPGTDIVTACRVGGWRGDSIRR
jgi:hypothetical protein